MPTLPPLLFELEETTPARVCIGLHTSRSPIHDRLVQWVRRWSLYPRRGGHSLARRTHWKMKSLVSPTSVLGFVLVLGSCGRIDYDPIGEGGIDSGGPPDTGLDSALVDAPMDAAHLDGATDGAAPDAAPCTSFGPFAPPRPVTQLNSSALEASPSLTATGLALYFSSFRDGDQDIYVSRRESVAAPWGSPTRTPKCHPMARSSTSSRSAPEVWATTTSGRPHAAAPRRDVGNRRRRKIILSHRGPHIGAVPPSPKPQTSSRSKKPASWARCSGGMYSKLRPRSMISQKSLVVTPSSDDRICSRRARGSSAISSAMRFA